MIKQYILIELKQFIYSISNYHGNKKFLTSQHLIKTSLNLLEDLPAAREVVLEYFAIVFDLSVGNYVSYMSKDAAAGETPYEDDFIHGIEEALENLIVKGPIAWSPLIASWSLELVGRFSNKYWPSRNLDIGSACSVWLNCGTMKSLLGLVVSAFKKMSNTEIESCIATMLNTFKRYSPTYDWVVARLGGCFPYKIISQILESGLKKFHEESHDSRCRFDSEIGILDYLSYAHENDLKQVIKELLERGFNSEIPLNMSIIPYILLLSTLSEHILQPSVSVFLEMYDETLLNKILEKTSIWKQNSIFNDMLPAFNNVVLKLKSNGAKLLLICSKLADQFNWCQDFIEFTLQELEQVVLHKHTCSLITDLIKEDSKRLLWKCAVSTNFIEQQTAVRLILLVSTQYQHIYHETIAELLTMSYDENKNGIGALIRLFGGFYGVVEFPDTKPGINMTLEKIQSQKKFHFTERHPECQNAIKNLITLTKLEKSNTSTHLRNCPVNAVLNKCLLKLLEILDCMLNKLSYEIEKANIFDEKIKIETICKKIKFEKDEIIELDTEETNTDQSIMEDNREITHSIVNLLNYIEAGSKNHVIGMTEILNMSHLIIKYFFWCLTQKNHIKREKSILCAFDLLKRHCAARKAARSVCLRDLIEGALFLYGNLFSGTTEEYDDDESNISTSERLISLNQKQGLGPNANRSVSHAGIIGKGLKFEILNNEQAISLKSDPDLQSYLLKAIDCCCQDPEKANIVDGYSTVSLLLVEMVSPDIMYNGLPFPDEEFTKVTVERDLQIRRTFKSTPILWSILGLVASHRPALCYSSVLLRALCASFLHQWRAKNVNKYESPEDSAELLNSTKKLLEVLAMGQLLPYPLSSLFMIIQYFEASEIALILKECVWNYLKDNVPSPALFQCDNTGLYWRNPSQVKLLPQYVDALRNLMQKKLTKLGPHYYQMFVLPELEQKTESEEMD